MGIATQPTAGHWSRITSSAVASTLLRYPTMSGFLHGVKLTCAALLVAVSFSGSAKAVPLRVKPKSTHNARQVRGKAATDKPRVTSPGKPGKLRGLLSRRRAAQTQEPSRPQKISLGNRVRKEARKTLSVRPSDPAARREFRKNIREDIRKRRTRAMSSWENRRRFRSVAKRLDRETRPLQNRIFEANRRLKANLIVKILDLPERRGIYVSSVGVFVGRADASGEIVRIGWLQLESRVEFKATAWLTASAALLASGVAMFMHGDPNARALFELSGLIPAYVGFMGVTFNMARALFEVPADARSRDREFFQSSQLTSRFFSSRTQAKLSRNIESAMAEPPDGPSWHRRR